MFGTSAKEISEAIGKKVKEDEGNTKEGVDLIKLTKDLSKRKAKKIAKKDKE
ncbi:hypothetical protein KAR91_81135 [Candidatus Pacearchaeota archaeon]|nr:hypothetical protein [Candidatus Pacearchaeota archaeon]